MVKQISTIKLADILMNPVLIENSNRSIIGETQKITQRKIDTTRNQMSLM